MRETVYRCAGPDCQLHVRSSASAPPRGWVLARERGDDGSLTDHDFCGWSCILRFAGRIEPDEVFEAAF
jgi:hypothetical protein